MNQLDRHIFALTFVGGTYASYLMGPLPQYEFTLKWLLILFSCCYGTAWAYTYLKIKKGFVLNILRTHVIYYIAFLVFWYIVSYAFDLVPLGPFEAFYRIAGMFLLGTPIVLYKLIPAAVVTLSLQYIYKAFKKDAPL